MAHHGSCLCGAITFTLGCELTQSDGCHCQQCRKWTGHFLASTDVPRSALIINGEQHLSWFGSSEKVRRGFCQNCGSSLFFDPIDKVKHDWIGIALGCFDSATHTTLHQHIFVAEKGDYYQLTDDAAQHLN